MSIHVIILKSARRDSIPVFPFHVEPGAYRCQDHDGPGRGVAVTPVQLGHELEIHAPDAGQEGQWDEDRGDDGEPFHDPVHAQVVVGDVEVDQRGGDLPATLRCLQDKQQLVLQVVIYRQEIRRDDAVVRAEQFGELLLQRLAVPADEHVFPAVALDRRPDILLFVVGIEQGLFQVAKGFLYSRDVIDRGGDQRIEQEHGQKSDGFLTYAEQVVVDRLVYRLKQVAVAFRKGNDRLVENKQGNMLRTQFLLLVIIAGIHDDQQVAIVFLDLGDVLGCQDVFRIDVVQSKLLGQTRDQFVVCQTSDLKPIDMVGADQLLERGA